jgi:pyruvate kinase
VFDGADAVMLSAETAAGQYPLEAVDMMDRIVTRVEQDEGWRVLTDTGCPAPEANVSGAIAAAATQVARSIGARAIAPCTDSGSTALRVARSRPVPPILAMCTEEPVARRLAVAWGVHAVVIPALHGMTEAVARATKLAREEGFARYGEVIVVVGGVPFGQRGTTNSLRVATVK